MYCVTSSSEQCGACCQSLSRELHCVTNDALAPLYRNIIAHAEVSRFKIYLRKQKYLGALMIYHKW